MFRRIISTTLACGLALTVLVAPAFAADPQLAPAPIYETFTFDSALPQNMALDKISMSSEPPPWAYWGRISNAYRGSSGASLWCAGTRIPYQYTAAGSFWPTYPYWGQLVQQTNEPVTLSLTTPKRLMQKGLSGGAVSSIVVKNTSGTVTYKQDLDYRVTTDIQGYTLIARISTTTIANGQTVHVSYKWPATGARGTATVQAPELADYYQSWVSFHYLMPSIGQRDLFTVHWYDPVSPNDKETVKDFALTAPGEWRRVPASGNGLELSAGNSVNLSRVPGAVSFQFFENREGYGELPRNGQGPAIDDVSFVGYKYGPVRNLDIIPSGTTLVLNWDKPYRSTGSTAPDEREVNYLVWRAPGQGPTYEWTQLTAEEISSPTHVDGTVIPGQTYTYLVQAQESGAGLGYGAPATHTGRLYSAGVDVSAAASPRTVVDSGEVTFSYRITNSGDTFDLTDIEVSDSLSGNPTVPSTTLAPGESMTATHVVELAATATSTVTVTGLSNGSPYESTDSITVTVIHPEISLSVAPTERFVSAGKLAEFEATISNEGDVPLTSIVVKDGSDATPVASLSGLGVGESTVVPFVREAGTVLGSVTTHQMKLTYDYDSGAPGSRQSTTVPVTVEVLPSRIFASTRYATAVAASQEAFDSAPAVVLATGQNFPDALSAGALAGAVGGPLLLVQKDAVPTDVIDEIKRLGATKAYFVGGTGVILDSVMDTVKAQTTVTQTDRMAEGSRFGTAAKVADEVARLAGTPDTVFLATGANFPDALAASSIAANRSWPILLTRKDELPQETHDALVALKPSRVVICGGVGAVSEAVSAAINGNPAYGSPTVLRKDGASRYETARNLIEWAAAEPGVAPDGGYDGLYLATGTAYPDALSGGVLAGIGRSDGKWRPLMLTKPTELVADASSAITASGNVGFVAVLGGTGAVSDAVRTSALQLIP